VAAAAQVVRVAPGLPVCAHVRADAAGDDQRLVVGVTLETAARKQLRVVVRDLGRVLPIVEALRRGNHAALRRRTMPTLGELVDEFTGQHVAEDSTIASLKFRLRYALDRPKLDSKAGWRDVKVDRLNPTEIGAWRKARPVRSAFGIHKALRQVLHYAVRAKLIDENPAALVPNPEPKRTEVQTFTLAELDLIGTESPPPSVASRCSPLLPGCGPASGWRSKDGTLTGRPALSPSVAPW
jgi:hypothetical protein